MDEFCFSALTRNVTKVQPLDSSSSSADQVAQDRRKVNTNFSTDKMRYETSGSMDGISTTHNKLLHFSTILL